MQRMPSGRARSRGIVALIGALAGVLAVHAIAAAPPGYRYVGSRSVSAGRVVLWYWNADIVEPDAGRVAFTAHLYARAPDVGQERPYLAIVRCDNRTYRPAMEAGPFQPIDDGEPIAAVWRAGCANGIAVGPAERRARMDGTAATAAAPMSAPSSAIPAAGAAGAAMAPAAVPTVAGSGTTAITPVAPASDSPTDSPGGIAPPPATVSADPRRVDACIRVADVKGSPAGEASITNTCRHPIEVTLCYKGGGDGPYDCARAVKGRFSDSLGPGVTHVLPEYRRARHRGIAAVACRGTAGTVFPRLEEPGQSGCH